jgi:hypothetical protein
MNRLRALHDAGRIEVGAGWRVAGGKDRGRSDANDVRADRVGGRRN